MVTMRQALRAAVLRNPEILGRLKGSLRARIGDDGALATMVDAAEALEPVIAEAVERRPSRLGKLGLRSTHLLASLAADDGSNARLARIASGGKVGIAFLDIAGFTAFTEQMGDHAARELLVSVRAAVEDRIGVGRGEVVKALGDGFLLAFPSASQAVRAALAIRSGLTTCGPQGHAGAVSIRIAVHAGEPLVEEDDLLGHDVNLTARLLDHCRPGEVVVSEAAAELAARRLRRIRFERGREVKIRGLMTPVRIYTARAVR